MAERPVECSHCKKSIKVIYKEIVNNSITVTEMCADCPVLAHKLQGEVTAKEGKVEEAMGLYCGHCHTSLESVKTGNPLGCSECYNVFADFLISDLIAAEEVPPLLQKNLKVKKAQLIHIGKSPKKPAVIAPPAKLTALNEALNEAIKRENYEQAASLRDQIKALLETKNEQK